MPLRRDSMKRQPDEVFAEPSAQKTTDHAAPIPGVVDDEGAVETRELAALNGSAPAGEVSLDDSPSHDPWGSNISPVRQDDVHKLMMEVVGSPARQGATESAGKSAGPDERFNKYLSPSNLDDPKEMKRQIRFKRQIVNTLRESCDKEITGLEAEILVLEQKLEAKRKPLIDSIQDAKMQQQAQTISPDSKHSTVKPEGGSLYDQFHAAIMARRQKLVDEGAAASLEDLEALKRKEWWRNRDVVDKVALNSARWAAVFGMLGCLCGVMQNELVLQERDPGDYLIEVLKVLNSLFTVACLLSIYRYYWLCALIFRINRHCRRLVRLDANIHFSHIASSWEFWLEVFFVGGHCPPFYTREYWTDSLGNIVVYRIETIAALVNTLRIYLVFRWLRDYELMRMDKRHTIATFSNTKFNNIFVLKRWLHGYRASFFLVIVWLLAMFLCAYWFRSAELTACYLKTTKLQEICSIPRASEWVLFAQKYEHQNNYYIWDSLWLMYITTSSVGYGDITPTTNMGRFCVAIITVQGILLGALLTATIMANLEWTPNERSTLSILERFKAREEVKAFAVAKLKRRMSRLLTNYRRRKSRAWAAQAAGGGYQTSVAPTPTQKTGLAGLYEGCFLAFLDAFGLRSGLMVREGQEATSRIQALRQHIEKDLGDLQPNQAKFDRLYRRCKYIEHAVQSIHERLEEGDFLDSLIAAQSRRLEIKKHKTKTAQHNAFEGTLQKLERQVSKNPNSEELHEHKTALTAPWLKVQRLRATIKKQALDRTLLDALQQDREVQKAQTIQVLDAMSERRHWSRDKEILSRKLFASNVQLMIIGIFGTCLSVVQNEMVIMGYGSVFMLNFCKTANSACSVVCVLLLANIYWLKYLLKGVLAHVHHFRELPSRMAGVGVVLSDPLFYLESFVCGVHCPPGLDYQYTSEIMGNFMVYRIETVFSSLNLIRIYLIWRAFADFMLADLPKRHTLAGFSRVELGTSFILKRMMNSWYAFFYLAFGWLLAVSVFGYWFRNAELTACQFVPMPVHRGANITTLLHEGCFKENARMWTIHGTEFEKINDTWLQNNVWLMFITFTTVGYGETLVTTHFGRYEIDVSTYIHEKQKVRGNTILLTASFAGVAGLILTALITASMGELLRWTPSEASANQILDREELRLRVQVFAVRIIERWWVRCLRRVAKIEISNQEYEDEKHLFIDDHEEMKLARTKLFCCLDDAATDSDKLDDIIKKTNHCEELIELIAFELWSHDIPGLIKMHESWEDDADKMKSLFYKSRKFQENLIALHGGQTIDPGGSAKKEEQETEK